MADRAQLLNDPEETFRLAFEGKQGSLWTAMPGIVLSVNFLKMTCTVQPAIQGVIEDENGKLEYVPLPVLADVPICFPRAGGFILTLPLAINDEVLVVWASRCIDAWWQSGGVQKPIEARMHDLSDGFAIPGPCSVPKIPAGAVSATGAQLRNDAGTTYIEISADGKIKLVSPTEVQINGNLKVTGEVTGHSETVPVNLTTHVHTGVTTGAGSTGGPVG